MPRPRLTKDQRPILERLVAGWRPLQTQIGQAGRQLERRGFIRFDWGPADTEDHDKLCAYITEAGRAALSPQATEQTVSQQQTVSETDPTPTVRMADPARYIPGAVCPACEKAWLKPERAHNSRSRFAETYICSACGAHEAFKGFFWKDGCLKHGIALNEAGQAIVYGRPTPR